MGNCGSKNKTRTCQKKYRSAFISFYSLFVLPDYYTLTQLQQLLVWPRFPRIRLKLDFIPHINKVWWKVWWKSRNPKEGIDQLWQTAAQNPSVSSLRHRWKLPQLPLCKCGWLRNAPWIPAVNLSTYAATLEPMGWKKKLCNRACFNLNKNVFMSFYLCRWSNDCLRNFFIDQSTDECQQRSNTTPPPIITGCPRETPMWEQHKSTSVCREFWPKTNQAIESMAARGHPGAAAPAGSLNEDSPTMPKDIPFSIGDPRLLHWCPFMCLKQTSHQFFLFFFWGGGGCHGFPVVLRWQIFG